MYSTTVYLYQQITKVLLVDTNGGYFQARWDPVYAKTLTVNKGVDNVLLFEFINQDQKPVNIAGSNFVFRLLNQQGTVLLVEKPMEILSASLGRAKVVLASMDTDTVVAQPGSYSIERASGNYVQAVYTGADAQARAGCDIVDSVMPQFMLSPVLTLPETYGKNQYFSNINNSWPDWTLTPQNFNAIQQTEFYSSHILTNGASLTTIKMDLVHYTGTVKIQGAETYQSVWYNATESRQYYNATETVYFNTVGFNPLLRVALNNSIGAGATANATVVDGVVTGVSVTNSGVGYVAAPYVQIFGDGSGAAAEAEYTGGGTMGEITITAGGSGYLPINFQGLVLATVLITNGAVLNLQYR